MVPLLFYSLVIGYSIFFSIGEIEIIMGRVIIKSHEETSSCNIWWNVSTGITEQNGEPQIPNILSIVGLFEQSIEDEFFGAAVHKMEVDVLVGGWAGMLNESLSFIRCIFYSFVVHSVVEVWQIYLAVMLHLQSGLRQMSETAPEHFHLIRVNMASSQLFDTWRMSILHRCCSSIFNFLINQTKSSVDINAPASRDDTII